MQKFMYSYPTRVYFGEGAAVDALKQELPRVGCRVMLAFGHDEQAAGIRPELASRLENLQRYDTIFLGYPIWNADLPMPVYTFLETYDLSGKTIVPFTVHGGSGFAGTIQTIQALQPGADVREDGFSISRNRVLEAPASVSEWAAALAL